MLVRRFDPFYEIRALEDRFLRNYQSEEKEAAISGFSPKVNTREGEFAYHVDIDLPGVKKEDIKVDVKEGVLTISGERNLKEEVKEEDYYKVETSFGKFMRTFTLPENVDIENIDASSDNGVLEIVIPKLVKQENVKSIEVK
jgi:HSP20 family protein